MTPSSEHLQYLAYILRLWQERSSGCNQAPVWRLSVEDVRTRERRGFSSPKELADFLQMQVEAETQKRSDKEI